MNSTFRWTAALAALVLAGAAGAAPVEVTVAAYPPLDAAVKAAIPAFEAAHPDVRVQVRSYPYGEYRTRMREALTSGSDLPDVMALEIGFAGDFARAGKLVDFSRAPYNARARLGELLGFSVGYVTLGERIYAVPVDVGVGTLFYRKDVLDRAGVSVEDLTRSWDSFVEAGKKVRAATGAKLIPNATMLYDILIRDGLAPGEGIFYGADGRPLVEGPRFQRAFALAAQAHHAGIDAGVEAWTKEWAEGLDHGTIAAQPSGAWLEWHLERWLAPHGKEKFRAAPLPGGAHATWGGSFLTIPDHADHHREAWALIQYLCFDREQQLRAYTETGAWPALVAAQDAPLMDEPIPYLGGQKARALWREAAARVPALRPGPVDGEAAGIVAKQLQLVLQQDKDIGKALADARAALPDVPAAERATPAAAPAAR